MPGPYDFAMNQYDTSLEGRRALVTGGGSGIGAAITTILRQAGAEVRVCDLDPATTPDYRCDVSDDDAVASMFRSLDTDLGGLDVCVNNVGIAGPTGPVEDMDPQQFDRCLQINVGSTFRIVRHAVPRFRAAGQGSIVNISSTAGHLGYPLRSPYAASKWAIEGLTATWAMELGRFDIRANCIAPGTVSGPRMQGVIDREAESMGVEPAAVKAGYEDQVSMRSFVDASDIAATAAFLCSDAARFINGQVISVDGNTETLRTNWSDDRRSSHGIEF